VEDSVTQSYYYSVGLDESGQMEEGRTDSHGQPLPHVQMSKMSFLTAGFAGSLVYFRPRYQAGSRYRYLGRMRKEPRDHLIAFAQRPGFAEVVGTFVTEYLAVPAQLLSQGFAWIDPETGQIRRMRTDLLAPRPDVLLLRSTSEIVFSEVRFASIPAAFWLPREVTVTLDANGRLYRNRHRYGEYQVLTVAAEDKIQLPPVKK
jgi:hypothetical protein